MELIKTFTPEQYERGLPYWAWIGLEGKAPIFTSLFGDLFLESAEGLWYLDTLEGSLDCFWQDRDELDADLATQDGAENYLLGGIAEGAATRRGLVLGPDEVYAFLPHPAMGGHVAVETMITQPFVVAMCITGQLHEQMQEGSRAGGRYS